MIRRTVHHENFCRDAGVGFENDGRLLWPADLLSWSGDARAAAVRLLRGDH